jgi:hypothetical protein
MNKDDQNIKGLEAAYQAVYKRPLFDRVSELCAEYADRVDDISTELNPRNSVPCFWKISELAEYYGSKHQNDMTTIPAAACGYCGGWTTQGGMSRHGKSVMPIYGRTGCTGPHC